MSDEPLGSLKPLDKYLKSIYIDKFSYNLYKDSKEKQLNFIENHKLFKGFYER